MGINESTLLQTLDKLEREMSHVEAFLSAIKKITNEARKNASYANSTHREVVEQMKAGNLQLLELQAIMQSNMQTWTTKSNILSADHRARMKMIEKFSAR